MRRPPRDSQNRCCPGAHLFDRPDRSVVGQPRVSNREVYAVRRFALDVAPDCQDPCPAVANHDLGAVLRAGKGTFHDNGRAGQALRARIWESVGDIGGVLDQADARDPPRLRSGLTITGKPPTTSIAGTISSSVSTVVKGTNRAGSRAQARRWASLLRGFPDHGGWQADKTEPLLQFGGADHRPLVDRDDAIDTAQRAKCIQQARNIVGCDFQADIGCGKRSTAAAACRRRRHESQPHAGPRLIGRWTDFRRSKKSWHGFLWHRNICDRVHSLSRVRRFGLFTRRATAIASTRSIGLSSLAIGKRGKAHSSTGVFREQ